MLLITVYCMNDLVIRHRHPNIYIIIYNYKKKNMFKTTLYIKNELFIIKLFDVA